MATEEFKKTYTENITNVDILINKVPQYAMFIIKDTIDKTIEMLVEEDIITIDEDIFLRKYYYKYFDFEKYYDPILEKYIEITEASDKLNEYRNIQKTTRSKWQGGGFGVSGAIKGAMTASVLNIGTDFLRSFGDSSQSRKDEQQINTMKKTLYNDTNTFSTLYKGIYNCIFGVFFGFIDELILNDIIEPVKLNPKECDVIFQNTLKYERDPMKIYKNIMDCLKMNPYNFELYKIIIESDDINKEILEMAIFFGFENQINDILKGKYKKQINNTINLSEANTNEMIAKIEKYIELMDISNIDYSEAIISLFKKLLYLVNSKEQLDLLYLKYVEIEENLLEEYPYLISDLQKMFHSELYKNYEGIQKFSEKSAKHNSTYKAIYANDNNSNDCKFLKAIKSNSQVFAFSLNGEKIAYINNNDENKEIQEIRVFDFSTKTVSNVLLYEMYDYGYLGEIIFIMFTQNMDYIFTVTESGKILKWDIELSIVTNTYNSKLRRISSVSYNTNNKTLILGELITEDNINASIEVFDIIKSETVRIYKANTTSISNLSCSSDGEYIAYSSRFSNDFYILDKETGGLNKTLVNAEATLYKFSDINKMIAYAYNDEDSIGQIVVWDYSKDESKCYLNCGSANIKDIAFSPNDKLLAVECSDKSDNFILLWDLDKRLLKVILTGYEPFSPSSTLKFSPDGKLLIAVEYNNEGKDTIVIWTIEDAILKPDNRQINVDEIPNGNENLTDKFQAMYDKSKIVSKGLPKKSIKQWVNRLVFPLIIFWGLALLFYNIIGNTIVKLIVTIFLFMTGIQSISNSIKDLKEMRKKNNSK